MNMDDREEGRMSIEAAMQRFGLSTYEARAYITLLKGGPMLVSELAYHANIPRTKAYSTLKSLEGKKLVILSASKPIRCHAVPPNECLGRYVKSEEKRLMEMKKALESLKKLEEEARKPLLVEEAKHLVLSTTGLISKLPEFISSCRTSLLCMLDTWGVRLITNSKDAMIKALDKGASIRLLLSRDAIDALERKLLDERIRIKVSVSNYGKSLFVLDEEGLIVVDNASGGGISINSRLLSSFIARSIFENYWKKALIYDDAIKRNLGIINYLVNGEAHKSFVKVAWELLNSKEAMIQLGIKLISKIEKDLGTSFFKQEPSKILPIFSSLLSNVAGDVINLRFDLNNGRLSLEVKNGALSKDKNLILLTVVLGYLGRIGIEPKLLTSSDGSKLSFLIHARV
jgi:sugar-specific transcriptional regulator TrmB